MRLVKRSPWLTGLGVLLAGVVIGGAARADVTSDDAGSIIIYPKVIADGSRDTLIQLSNRSNATVFVHCFYVNGSGQCSLTSEQSCVLDTDCPVPESCVQSCVENDFDVILTAQQPTVWRASTGRLSSLTPGPCRSGQPCACTTGINGQQVCPGLEVAANNAPFVPATGTDFRGELKCYQTTSDGAPVSGNSLKGTATIETLASGQISEYNALTITANTALMSGLNTDSDLQLNLPSGGTVGEYNACPNDLVFTTAASGAVDSATNATVSTELTLVPCTELIEEAAPVPVLVNFLGYNEFEQPLSARLTFDCFFNGTLADIPGAAFDVSNGNLWKIRVTPSSDSVCLTGDNRGQVCTTDMDCGANVLTSPGGLSLGCRPAPGVLGVVEEFYSLPGLPDGTAAFNVHMEGQRTGFGDIITVPALQ